MLCLKKRNKIDVGFLDVLVANFLLVAAICNKYQFTGTKDRG